MEPDLRPTGCRTLLTFAAWQPWFFNKFCTAPALRRVGCVSGCCASKNKQMVHCELHATFRYASDLPKHRSKLCELVVLDAPSDNFTCSDKVHCSEMQSQSSGANQTDQSHQWPRQQNAVLQHQNANNPLQDHRADATNVCNFLGSSTFESSRKRSFLLASKHAAKRWSNLWGKPRWEWPEKPNVAKHRTGLPSSLLTATADWGFIAIERTFATGASTWMC